MPIQDPGTIETKEILPRPKFFTAFQIHVMIVGGEQTSTGSEVWNPDAGSVQILADKHPQEAGSAALEKAQLIPVNGNNPVFSNNGTELRDSINVQLSSRQITQV